MISRYLLRSLLSIAFLFVLHSPAKAQGELATGEDVAFAFFKTAASNPDFDRWARGTEGYKRVAPAFAAQYLQEERQRLMRRWKDEEKRETSLEVQMSVAVNLGYTKSKNGKDEYWMNIEIPKQDVFYLPYIFQDYSFAIMPQGLEKILLHTIHLEQYELMRAQFGGNLSGSSSLHLQLKPTKAYIDQPYDIDGKEQWVLVADIPAVSLKSTNGGMALWNYTAPWYVSPVKRELGTLYNTPSTAAPVPQTP